MSSLRTQATYFALRCSAICTRADLAHPERPLYFIVCGLSLLLWRQLPSSILLPGCEVTTSRNGRRLRCSAGRCLVDRASTIRQWQYWYRSLLSLVHPRSDKPTDALSMKAVVFSASMRRRAACPRVYANTLGLSQTNSTRSSCSATDAGCGEN